MPFTSLPRAGRLANTPREAPRTRPMVNGSLCTCEGQLWTQAQHGSHGKPESGWGHFGVTESMVCTREKAGPIPQALNVNICGSENLKES